jgi:hypothetical protein
MKRLLERYWQCETSIEEEQKLGDFFASDSVPENLKMVETLFVWKSRQKAIQRTPVHPVVSKQPIMQYFYPALKVAASFLVVTTLSISVYTHYQQNKFMNEVLSESTLDALDMRRDSIGVMAKVSLQIMPEEDSLRSKDGRSSQ